MLSRTRFSRPALVLGLPLAFVLTVDAQSTGASASAGSHQFRTIDGTLNNLANPDWGAAHTDLLRAAPADYGDGLDSPAGSHRASAREVSNAVSAQSGSTLNDRRASDWIWQWGQFLDHDIDLTDNHVPAQPLDIAVPMGDPFFDPFNTGTQVIGFNRSLHHHDGLGVRQQINEITAWIDGSNVYGSDDARATELRTMDGTGRLATTPSAHGPLLPYNVNGLPNAPDSSAAFFLAGDVRANEQNGLTAAHTLFVREHNYWATVFGFVFPFLPGEWRYQMARSVVIGELQKITYDEFLPALLGRHALSPYSGYQPTTNPGIGNAFSTASYRFGHSMLSSTLMRLDSDLDPIPAGNIELRDAFFNPQEIVDNGIDALLLGLANQQAQAVDVEVIDDVRNFLFGPPGAGGFDLASLNIQRGRDHGVPSYNDLRVAYGLAPAASFADVSSDAAVQQRLQDAYASVNDIDAWVGGLAEDHVQGALVGELVREVLADQFERLRDGDRFWYERYLGPALLFIVERQSLATVIRRNTDIGGELQRNVFRVRRGNHHGGVATAQ